MVVLGIGGAIEFSLKLGKASLSTTSSGLSLVGLGMLLAGVVATRLPPQVRVFSRSSQLSFAEQVVAYAGPLLLAGAVALVAATTLALR